MKGLLVLNYSHVEDFVFYIFDFYSFSKKGLNCGKIGLTPPYTLSVVGLTFTCLWIVLSFTFLLLQIIW